MLLLTQQIDFDSPVDLWHFYLLRSVGKGAFGKVGRRDRTIMEGADIDASHRIAIAGPRGPAQADKGAVCSQIHQQGCESGLRQTSATRRPQQPGLLRPSLASC